MTSLRKVTVVPEGKNHGLIMYVDWSGSMNHNFLIQSSKYTTWFGSVVKHKFHSVCMVSRVDIHMDMTLMHKGIVAKEKLFEL